MCEDCRFPKKGGGRASGYRIAPKENNSSGLSFGIWWMALVSLRLLRLANSYSKPMGYSTACSQGLETQGPNATPSILKTCLSAKARCKAEIAAAFQWDPSKMLDVKDMQDDSTDPGTTRLASRQPKVKSRISHRTRPQKACHR